MDDKLKRLVSILNKKTLDALLISSVPNIIYLTEYGGFSHFEREAFLLISKNENYLITDGRYSEAVSGIPGFKLLEISPLNPLEKILETLSNTISKIGIEENNISVSEHRKLKKHFKIVPVKELQNLRIIKEPDEIKKIENACKLGDKAFDFILIKLKTGIAESEIAFEIEMFVKKNGGELSFPSIVAFGKNSSMPHHKTGSTKLSKNQIVLLDFGVKLEDYCSDMTRTIFFGIADDKFRKIYNTVLESQKKAIDSIKSSISTSKVDLIARNHITKSGFPTIPHSLGHGTGIEVHEPPRLSSNSKDILKPRMVFSIEPGIYIPSYGGVRIEDLFVLEEKDVRALTHSPKNLIEI